MLFIILIVTVLTASTAGYLAGLVLGSGLTLYHVLSNDLDRLSSQLSEQLADIDSALKEIKEDVASLKDTVDRLDDNRRAPEELAQMIEEIRAARQRHLEGL